MKHLLLTTIAAVVLVGTAFADPIHDAARDGDLAGVQAELDKGVDVNAKRGWSEWTPLHEAANYGHKEIVELLIHNGADVNATDVEEGRTPLHQAAEGLRAHRSHRISVKGVWSWCRRCGAHTRGHRIVRLARPCERFPEGTAALRRVRDGRPPLATCTDWGEPDPAGSGA